MPVVLGRRPQQAGPADVDIFQQLLGRQPFIPHGRERVQIDYHQVDRFLRQFLQVLAMAGFVAVV